MILDCDILEIMDLVKEDDYDNKKGLSKKQLINLRDRLITYDYVNDNNDKELLEYAARIRFAIQAFKKTPAYMYDKKRYYFYDTLDFAICRAITNLNGAYLEDYYIHNDGRLESKVEEVEEKVRVRNE